MENSKISRILRSFTKDEIKTFEKFITSSYFNGGRNFLPLFKIIKKYYPAFNSPHFNMQNIYSELYGREYNPAVIKTMISGLIDLAEKFLVHNSIKNNEQENYRILAGELRERKLFNYFDIVKKEALKKLSKTELRNYEFYYDNYILAHESSLVELSGNLGYSDPEKAISTAESYFFKFVILRLCELYQSVAMNSRFLRNSPFQFNYYDLMMNYLTQNKDSDDDAVRTYYLFYMLLQTGEYRYYSGMKNMLSGTKGIFGLSEEKNFYVTMHNYLLLKLEDEKNIELQEYLKALNDLIEKGYLTQNDGYINPSAITNAVLLADKYSDTVILQKFIDDNINKINPAIKESERFRLNSILFFKRDMFENSLKEAAKVKTENYNLRLFADVIKLMNCYELNLPDTVEEIIKTNLRYLKNHPEIPERRNAGFKNFAIAYRKLIDKKFYYKDINKEDLLKLAGKVNSPFRKKWLLKKISDFK